MDRNHIPADLPMAQVLAFAKSPAGQQLIRLLQQKNSPEVENAARMAASGNSAQAKDALSGLLSDPQVRELLKQFGG